MPHEASDYRDAATQQCFVSAKPDSVEYYIVNAIEYSKQVEVEFIVRKSQWSYQLLKRETSLISTKYVDFMSKSCIMYEWTEFSIYSLKHTYPQEKR